MATLTEGAPAIFKDVIELLRDARHVLTSISTSRIWGLRVDVPLHLFGAALIYVVLRRFFSRRAAVITTCLALVLKELGDMFIKSSAQYVNLTPKYDTITDLLSGAAGLGLGMLIGRVIGERLTVRRSLEPLPVPPPTDVCYSPPISWAMHGALGALCLVLLAGGLIFAGTGGHLALAAMVIIACRLFGPANVLIVALPCVPYANYLYWTYDPGTWYYYASDTIVLTLALYVIGSRLARRDMTFRRLTIDPLVLAYVVLALGSVAWNLRTPAPAFPKVKQCICVVEALAVYFLVIHLIRTPHHLRRAAWFLLGSIGLTCLIALVEAFVREPFVLQGVPGSVYRNAERFSVYATMMAPVALMLAFLARGWRRWLFALVAALALIMVVMTASRSGWVSGLVSTAAVIVFVSWRRDWGLGLAVTFGLALVLGLAAATLDQAASRRPVYRTPIVREILSISPGHITASFERSRGSITDRAIGEIRERPFLGYGGTEINRTSIYLYLAVDSGLIAAACVLVAIAWVICRNLRLGGRVRDPLLAALACGCGFGLIGVLVEGVGVGFGARRIFVPLVWYLIALGPAVIAVEGAQNRDREEPRSGLLEAALLCTAALALAAVVYAAL